MDRAKIIFVAITVVAVGVAVALGLVAKGKFEEAKQSTMTEQSARGRLNGIYGKEVFPSEENLKTLEKLNEGFLEERDAFTNRLERCNVPMVQKAPAAFVQTLSTAIQRLSDKAPVLDGVKPIAPNFAFGFDAYVGQNPAMPSESEVPLLGQQLVIVNDIVHQMYEAKIAKIAVVQREAKDKATLESGSAKTSVGGRGGRRRGGSDAEPEEAPVVQKGTNVKKGAKGSKGTVEPKAPLYTSQRLTLTFTARQAALVDFLNRLASMKNFVVVKSIDVKKSAPDIKMPTAEAAMVEEAEEEIGRKESRTRGVRNKGKTTRAEKETKTEKTVAAAPKISELPAEMRIMTGVEIDPLLQVTLNIEVYTFGKEVK